MYGTARIRNKLRVLAEPVVPYQYRSKSPRSLPGHDRRCACRFKLMGVEFTVERCFGVMESQVDGERKTAERERDDEGIIDVNGNQTGAIEVSQP